MQMEIEKILSENQELKEKILKLENELVDTKEHLKNYTAPKRSKTFYENHKEELIKKNKEYKDKINYYGNLSQEKKKEYARQAYLNKKAKLKNESKINSEGNI